MGWKDEDIEDTILVSQHEAILEETIGKVKAIHARCEKELADNYNSTLKKISIVSAVGSVLSGIVIGVCLWLAVCVKDIHL